jgi:UDP-N-acetyl-D-glucosamine/UDP-N-acetyl-D-galactosamine dehydrogenase
MKRDKIVLGIIGLGYVGLPLAIEFGKIFKTMGFDINSSRVKDLNKGIDSTLEVNPKQIKESKFLNIVDKEIYLKGVNVYIVTVPTPVDKNNNPDLKIIVNATELVGKYLKRNDIVIFESTVYPGLTEEICVPILEKTSGLKYNLDFFCGYSPERINPGDKVHTLTKIKKIVSGSNEETTLKINDIYSKIIDAGTYIAPSIKVAEAAKVIENAQRDINIAFINELAKIFNLLNIDTNEVLDAASTKWNFLPFRPGLVGGHCIGVDPFYLAQKAIALGYDSEIILAGRRLNDGMSKYVSEEFLKLLIENGIKIKGCKVLILGVTFKENCPDIRNSKVFEIIDILEQYGIDLEIHDPWVNTSKNKIKYKVNSKLETNQDYSGILVCVGHDRFLKYPFINWKKRGSLIYDVKGFLDKKISNKRL